jgi:hypothetical protein
MDSSSVLEFLDVNSFMSREDDDRIQRSKENKIKARKVFGDDQSKYQKGAMIDK